MRSPPEITLASCGVARDQLPATLRAWKVRSLDADSPRGYRGYRDVWAPLEPFFSAHGIELWPLRGCELQTYSPADSKGGAPDGFTYDTPLNIENQQHVPVFQSWRSVHCPASTGEGRHVMVRIVCVGGEGASHLKALRTVASGGVEHLGTNHALPMLREIVCEDVVFAVFPLMHQAAFPWFRTLGEVMDVIEQVVEGVKFLHERLVAHPDLFLDNILLIAVGTGLLPLEDGDMNYPPFRELFPVRYYINDFEMAVVFAPGSEPASRVVSGLPCGKTKHEYARTPGPEMLLDAPYCPFKADIFQLGETLRNHFGHMEELELGPLLDDMQVENPADRPTAAEVHERLKSNRLMTSPHTLGLYAELPPSAWD